MRKKRKIVAVGQRKPLDIERLATVIVALADSFAKAEQEAQPTDEVGSADTDEAA